MDEFYFKRIMSLLIFALLAVLSFFLLKPILLSIIIGIILAFVFTPLYNWLYRRTKAKRISSLIICIFLILLIILPLWFLTPIIIDQSFKVFQASQNVDIVTPLKKIFPSLFASQEFSAEVGQTIQSFIIKAINNFLNSLSRIILNFPTLFLQLIVVFFTFHFVLVDEENFISYIKSLLPFSEKTQKKLFESSRDLTLSVIYGQVIVGILQGLLVGIGFFLFGAPNALLLTLFACLAGIFPVIGTAIVWVPVCIYLLFAGNTFSMVGIAIFGLISSSMDSLLRPIIVSKRSHIHSSIILLGMIGGFFLFGLLGFILGPLILAYLLIILELYRKKNAPSIFIKYSPNKKN